MCRAQVPFSREHQQQSVGKKSIQSNCDIVHKPCSTNGNQNNFIFETYFTVLGQTNEDMFANISTKCTTILTYRITDCSSCLTLFVPNTFLLNTAGCQAAETIDVETGLYLIHSSFLKGLQTLEWYKHTQTHIHTHTLKERVTSLSHTCTDYREVFNTFYQDRTGLIILAEEWGCCVLFYLRKP